MNLITKIVGGIVLITVLWQVSFRVVANEETEIQMSPEEFAREVCTTLKDKGLLKIEYNGVEYVCADFEE